MAQAYLDLLDAFNFTEMQAWIAVMSAFLFACCLLGGILSALTFVNSSLLTPRPLSERISFRLFIIGEVTLWIFVFFYHVFMIESITLSHVVYWFSATLMMPLLGIIGSQSILVTFSSRVNAKAKEYKRRQSAKREKRRKEMEDDGDEPAPKPKAKANPKARPAH